MPTCRTGYVKEVQQPAKDRKRRCDDRKHQGRHPRDMLRLRPDLSEQAAHQTPSPTNQSNLPNRVDKISGNKAGDATHPVLLSPEPPLSGLALQSAPDQPGGSSPGSSQVP